jgi:hypothetical protein
MINPIFLCSRPEGRMSGRMKLQNMQPGSYLTLDRRRQHRTKGKIVFSRLVARLD